MVVSAMNFIGVRYRRGGSSAETGFDCSGFTRHVFETSLGLVLPRRADEQAAMPGLVKVERSDLKPGDLVFFNTRRFAFSHVGIYLGDNRFIHAPRRGREVEVATIDSGYWQRHFNGARRLIGVLPEMIPMLVGEAIAAPLFPPEAVSPPLVPAEPEAQP